MNVRLRSLHADDRRPIRDLLRRTGHFTEQEIDIALELADAVLNKTDPDYRFVVAEYSGASVAGYGCWGAAPLTQGTYDIYWIAVSPELQGQGVGSRILTHMESRIAEHGGRLILIETSSSDLYRNTCAFYIRRGYVLESRIKDFYKIGDDKIIYAKRCRPSGQEKTKNG